MLIKNVIYNKIERAPFVQISLELILEILKEILGKKNIIQVI